MHDKAKKPIAMDIWVEILLYSAYMISQYNIFKYMLYAFVFLDLSEK